MREVARHNTPADLWVVIKGRVYDLTAFHTSHPGGARVVAAVAGKDATQAFDPFHPGDIIERMGLRPIGVVDAATIQPTDVAGGESDAGSGSDDDDDDVGADKTSSTSSWVKPKLGNSTIYLMFDTRLDSALSMVKS